MANLVEVARNVRVFGDEWILLTQPFTKAMLRALPTLTLTPFFRLPPNPARTVLGQQDAHRTR